MACIYMEGYEAGLAWLSPTTVDHGSDGLNIAAGRAGGWCLQGSSGSTMVRHNIVSGSDTIYFGWAAKMDFNNMGSTSGGGQLFSIFADTQTVQHLSVTTNASGNIVLRRGNSAGTIIQTSTLAMSLSVSVWAYWEAKVTISDTVGECVIKRDGVEWINFTGDTKNAGTSTRPDAVLFGIGTPGWRYNDDVVVYDTTGPINNSWTGEVSIIGLYPANNGASSQLLGSDGNSVNNYQQVDENPPLTADYNGSATAGMIDTYDMAAVNRVGNIIAVKPGFVAAKDTAGLKSIKLVTRSALGTVAKSAAIPLSNTYQRLDAAMTITDPDGNPWTVARLDASEFGIEVQ